MAPSQFELAQCIDADKSTCFGGRSEKVLKCGRTRYPNFPLFPCKYQNQTEARQLRIQLNFRSLQTGDLTLTPQLIISRYQVEKKIILGHFPSCQEFEILSTNSAQIDQIQMASIFLWPQTSVSQKPISKLPTIKRVPRI